MIGEVAAVLSALKALNDGIQTIKQSAGNAGDLQAIIGRYAGARFKLGDDAECRIINDDEVIATIEDPDDIVSV